ncbi:MAG TPA: hypothetical protein PK593_00500 [Thermomicrobiales bacterium]|jgi:hypothetical protein|nr:hypothetical protein [Chloroflexota bacterium]HCG30741.1 hypothetical protein [Chloroflexota bacterium]HQX61914.1 hypothetical protein [Thermomicrobiales bacterium]HQZ89347.1 hypothetical protein [Thermomicrobiales bacterium]HRA30797.1 hypothetical protein [Thermomicrobiales bacterium]
MINPTELDTRLMNHVACVDAANRYGALISPKRRKQDGPGSFVLQLRRLAGWFGLAQVSQPKGGGIAA